MAEMNVGNIRIKSAKRKPSKHNLDLHVNTSSSMTDVQPLFVNQCDAGDKNIVSIESMVWVAPLLKPVFGNATYDQWHYFVKLSDLTNVFGQLLTQTRKATGDLGVASQPSKLPSMTKGALCAMCLYESHLTLWKGADSDFNGNVSGKYTLHAGTGDNAGDLDAFITAITSTYNWLRYDVERDFDGYTGWSLNIDKFVKDLFRSDDGGALGAGSAFIPLNNYQRSDFVDSRTEDNASDYSRHGIDVSPVMLEDADFVIEKETPTASGGYRYAFAFRFSDFGRRLKKVLEGCGIRCDLTDTSEISLMPLFAYFKAYFDCFGLLQYINWEDTACAKLLAMYDAAPLKWDFSQGLYKVTGTSDAWALRIYELWQEFIRDLSFAFTTDAANFVSAHQRTLNPGVHVPDTDWMENTFDVDQHFVNEGQINKGNAGFPGYDDQHGLSGNLGSLPFIQQLKHGNLDSELVKRLTLQLNEETVIGQRVYELARAMGLGDWLDKQKVNFIGHTSVPINFGQVMAQADTYTKVTGDGMPLGDRAGKAQGYAQGKTFKYKCDVQGFYVVLAAVMPRSEFSQQDDLKTRCNSKYRFFNPRYDGLGFEANPKSAVCGDLDWVMISNDDEASPDYKPLMQTFGFAPTYTRLKYLPSRCSGDFSLRSTRGYNLPRCLDKFVELNSHVVDTKETTGSTIATRKTVSFIDSNFIASHLPVAGNLWRYTARYQWLSNLYRIFTAFGQTPEDFNEWGSQSAEFYEFFARSMDNFILQHDISYKQYSQKLQLGDSFETTDDANDGKTDMNVGKA